MTQETARQLVKQLETIVFLQKDCLDMGNWEDYDKMTGEIKKIEDRIVFSTSEKQE